MRKNVDMGSYDIANLINEATFETEIFPSVYWVPFASLGKSNIIFTEKVLDRITKDTFKELIGSPYEFIQYIKMADFHRCFDNQYIWKNGIQWEVHTSGRLAIQNRKGSCSSLSGAFYDTFCDRYPTGIICALANSGVGHTFNYIKINDFFYIIDPYVQMNEFSENIPKESGLKSDFVRTKYISGICIKTLKLDNFINFFERYNHLKKREFLYFTYMADTCPPVSINLEGTNASIIFPYGYSLEILPLKSKKIRFTFEEFN